MDYFQYKNDQLFAESVAVETIAKTHGTPVFVYSKATLERHWYAFENAFQSQPHLICYAVKANSNLAVLQTLARLGSGFDVVSGGEIYRALKAGADPQKIIFSGVGKTKEEITYALNKGIACFNVESSNELYRIAAIAEQLQVQAPISIRVNPDVDAKTHPYISTGLKDNKFGVSQAEAMKLYLEMQSMPWVNAIGIDCHIGSQLTDLSPFLESLDLLLSMIETLHSQGITIQHLDLGGGLGVPYKDETPPHPSEFAKAIAERMSSWQGPKLKLILEPGRAIAANAGILVTRVEHIKITDSKNFLIVDAAMNDLIRPSLYQAWQAIIPVNRDETLEEKNYDVVGPVCESGDYFGKDRALRLKEDDLCVIRSAGAYGFCMSSNYNTRNRAAEVLVDDTEMHLVRSRETLEDQLALETLLP